MDLLIFFRQFDFDNVHVYGRIKERKRKKNKSIIFGMEFIKKDIIKPLTKHDRIILLLLKQIRNALLSSREMVAVVA